MADIKAFYRGDQKTYKFDFGAGTDITNWKIFLTFKEAIDDSDSSAALQVSNTAGDNVLDDIANGIMYLTLTSTDSANLDPEVNYYYGFQRVIVGTSPIDVKTLLTGRVKILQDITLSTA